MSPRARAFLLLCCAATLWSTAGVLTRHLEQARSFEVTFWRSSFAALFVLVALAVTRSGSVAGAIRATGRYGMVSGAMWSVMFTCFMIALTLTSTANTLLMSSLGPLTTTLLAAVVLRERVPARTWVAIAMAMAGMLWMFSARQDPGASTVRATDALGMLVALGVPLAAAVNVVTLRRASAKVDMVPAVLIGACVSASVMLPFALPLSATPRDLAILAFLGFFQLGLPCMLLVAASKHLRAPEISLVSLLEVVLGPVWAWLGAGERPSAATLTGGLFILGALALNQLWSLGRSMQARNSAN